jgi:hypothetical protein
VTPEQHPDPLETIEIMKPIEIRIEHFDVPLGACRAKRLDWCAACTVERGMHDADLR